MLFWQALERIQLVGIGERGGLLTRSELRKKLTPNPKVLMLLAALGRQVMLPSLRQAVMDVVNSELCW